MKTIYFISGLGADERVFRYLSLESYEKKYIKWLKPLPNEGLYHYCQRLTAQISPSDNAILIGVSFGGIVAQVISRIVEVEKVIIISSIKSPAELDWKLRLVKLTKLHKFIPSKIIKALNIMTADYYFGTENPDQSQLLRQIIDDTDTFFMKWAISEIMKWESEHSSDVIHIHGSNDRVFPFGKIKNAIIIKDSGHFMIVNRSAQISKILTESIENM